jgi:hypothetical protein
LWQPRRFRFFDPGEGNPLLRLSDENLRTLQTTAAPLDPRDRARYLEAVAEALRDHPDLRSGEFHRACRAIASRFRSARSDADPEDAIDGLPQADVCVRCLGDVPPPSPPAEKATARQEQAR